MKKSRKALLASALSLLLCVSMLLGTTYAWFTDSVTSGNNIIQSGNLDIEMEYWDADGKEWKAVKTDTSLFEEDTLWEPGYTQVVYLRVANKGTLALKYQLGINIAGETGGIRVDEATGKDTAFKLSDSIYMGVKEDVNGETGAYATREDAVKAVEGKSGIISKGFNKYGDMAANDPEQYLAVVVYMPESVGNEANHKTGTDAPKITLGIKLLATQKAAELDSFGSDYDAAAKHPYGDVNYTAAEEVPAEKISTDPVTNERKLTEAVTVGNESDGIYAEVPDGVKLADGATALELTVQAMDESNATVTMEKGVIANSLDIHVEGVAEDNTVPMLITLDGLLQVGLNNSNVKLYHVENGVTVPMTMVTNPVNHNEFSYDSLTGDVVVAMASFSEVVAAAEVDAGWDGTTVTAFAEAKGTSDDPYIIANAEQFVYFRDQVDGGNAFEGKVVKLNADINLNGYNFDPIGWGYANAEYNRDSVKGKPFRGTFDGNGKTIYGLYQNGWDLETATGTDYTYTNCGGGLFASIANGTVQNLTISGANIVMECVEMGVLVGLSQGNCTYDNINIFGCKIANYQRATGGLIGEVSPLDGSTNETIITNVKIGSNTTVGSLWGDFDCPVGGVIGARWDDSDASTVVMKNVYISCELDVYNDVTSTYQWYAYRRAGMLIGNTDTPPADGKNSKVATADFLTCLPDENGNDSVVVIYDDWANYHYCQFSNYKSSWPWVRVEAGENCSAYSNPRYGQPYDAAGKQVQDALHSHQEGDECMVELPFHQLYGGGQGVYGQAEHEGVTEGLYTISYMDDGKIIHVDYVTGTATLWDVEEYKNINGENPLYWVDVNGEKVTSISNPNNNDLTFYPYWPGKFAIRFLDAENNVLYYQMFTQGDTTDTLDTSAVEEARAALQNKVDASGEVIHISWDTDPAGINLSSASGDIIVKAVYTLADNKMILEPVYDTDGTTLLAYQLADYDISSNEYANIVIPERVGLIPVVGINNDVFAGYTNLVSVVIPETVESIGSNAFEDGAGWPATSGRSTITIYYDGDSKLWKQYMDLFYTDNSYYREYNTVETYPEDATTILASGWDDGLGDGSRIFFLGADGKVDEDAGYWELYHHTEGNFWESGYHQYTWVYHGHEYAQGVAHSGCDRPVSSENYPDYVNGTPQLDGSNRPDQVYWSATT